MEWLIAFAIGILCAWLLLRSLKWLPVVFLMVLPASGQMYIQVFNDGGSSITANGVWGSACGTGSSPYSASVPPGGSAYLGPFSGNVGWNVWVISSGCGSASPCQVTTGGGVLVWHVNGCAWTCSGCTTPTYNFNGCLTNNTGHPATYTVSDACSFSQSQNLPPGAFWCISYTNSNYACYPLTVSIQQFDGPQSWGGPYYPNSTNGPLSPPVSTPFPGIPGGGGLGDPGGIGTVPLGTNALTGNQFGAGVTSIVNNAYYNANYLGNVIGNGMNNLLAGQNTGFNNLSNQGITQLAYTRSASNAFNDLNGNLITLTNEMGSNGQSSPYLTYLTNQPGIRGLLGQIETNTFGLTNFSTNLDNFAGSNLFWVGGIISTGDQSVPWSMGAGRTNAGAIGMGFTNALGTNAMGQMGLISVISNISIPSPNGSLWVVPCRTNLAGTGYTGTSAGSGLDLNPLHQSFFNAFAGWVRIMAYWTILAFYLTWAYNLFYDRAEKIPLVPSEAMKGDATLGAFTLPVRLGIWGASIVAFPAAIWAVLGSWSSWPGASGAPVSPFAGTTLAGFGVWGPLMGESMAIVDQFLPLVFACSVVASMPIVRIAADSIAMFLMLKVKWL